MANYKIDSCETDSDNLRLWDMMPYSFKSYFLILVNESSHKMNDFKWDHLDHDLQKNLLSIKDSISNRTSKWMNMGNKIFGTVLNQNNFDVCLNKNEIKQLILDFVDSEFEIQLEKLVQPKTKPSPIFGFDLINILLGLILNPNYI